MSDIKSCPFCGGDAKIFIGASYTSGHGQSDNEVGIKCDTCPAAMLLDNYVGYQEQDRIQEMENKWNRRV